MSFTGGYEGKIGQSYSELGRNEGDPDGWGNVISPDGNWINIYTDPGAIETLFTNIAEKTVPDKDETFVGADLGGAEGTVANIVQNQLREAGYVQAHVIDCELLQKNLDKKNEKFSEVLGVQANITGQPFDGHFDEKGLPLNENTVDFAILRFVLPYLNEEGQKEALTEAFSALKIGGRLVILQDGALDKDRGDAFNQFFGKSSAAQGGLPLEQVLANRHFASGEELSEWANEIGFKVEEVKELTDEYQGFLSPEAYASRFNMTPEQVENLRQVYQAEKESGKLEFVLDQQSGIIRVKRPMIYLVLCKIAKEKGE